MLRQALQRYGADAASLPAGIEARDRRFGSLRALARVAPRQGRRRLADRLVPGGTVLAAVGLGIGIGALAGKALRIAHRGHVNAPMILGTLGALEMALIALGVPHGRGRAQAAVGLLGRTLAS